MFLPNNEKKLPHPRGHGVVGSSFSLNVDRPAKPVLKTFAWGPDLPTLDSRLRWGHFSLTGESALA